MSARATRLARFNQRATVRERPVLHAPAPAVSTPPPRAARRQRLLLVTALLVIVALAGLLTSAWQRTQALEAQVGTLQDNVTTLRASAAQQSSRESDLDKLLQLQKDKLAGQDVQLQSTGQDLQSMQQELQDLRARMGRLDLHNAELRDALGLSDSGDEAPAAVPTAAVTATPGPNGFVPGGEGGESGPLYALALAAPLTTPPPATGDTLTDLRAQIAEVRHSLDAFELVEDNLTSFAADRIQQWAEMDEDDDTTAPPDVVPDQPEPPAPAADNPPPGRAPTPGPRRSTQPAPAAPSHIPSGLPYYGIITSPFGWRSSPFVKGKVGFHKGMDIAARTGTPVHATQAGRVVVAGWSDVYGRMVMVDHGAGWQTLYGHNSRLVVKVGDWVDKGEVIAYSGSTGMSTGPHIHYEIRYNGTPVNPAKYR